MTTSNRHEFHGIMEPERRILKQNKDIVLGLLPDVMDKFYDYISLFPETSAFFRSRDHMMHAKAMQIRHWEIILDAEFGAEYLASVTKIGEVHSRIGLEPKWYIGGYNFLLCALLDATGKSRNGGGGKLPAWWPAYLRQNDGLALQQALTKAVMLDMDYVIGIYLETGRRERTATVNGLADDFEGAVGGIVSHLDESARGLNKMAAEISSMSQRVLGQTEAVAGASEQTSANVHAVAAAAEELVASIAEISRQVADAAELADHAREGASRAETQVGELSTETQNIGDVVSIIAGIADQTNLLALNATIEAARAGEHGRGFAVVATEVKTLANQTAKATETISTQIAGVQASTANAVKVIHEISEVIGALNDVARAVAGAVQMQGGATHEISHNIQQLAAGTSEVAQNTAGIAGSMHDTAESSHYVLTLSSDLAGSAEKLKEKVRTFLEHARAA
ncbi:MAG: methyl-accepting chemotaxis protein [Pseudochelatococcus sp.]|uniref:methyl-accepting chemotaxis protein n=1 Tax=Pseudochelatococcus sp. TaxID=2020869 RepID=UPI003D8C6DFE